MYVYTNVCQSPCVYYRWEAHSCTNILIMNPTEMFSAGTSDNDTNMVSVNVKHIVILYQSASIEVKLVT